MPELGMTVLPGSVVASHLHASASGLADGTVPARVRSCIETPRELAEVIDHLVAGQRQIAATLAQLADYVHDRRLDRALSEVLRASAEAAGFSAEALAESECLLHGVLDVTGPDTRL